MKPIAIIRMAAQSALGTNVADHVAALRAGVVGIGSPKHLEQMPRNYCGAGEIPNSMSYGGDCRAEYMLKHSFTELLTCVEREAITLRPDRWGIVLGTTLAGMRHCGEGLRREASGRADQSDKHYARTVASAVLGSAIQDLGISGPTLTVSCACASGLSAISHACSLLEAGAVDWVIAGGYDPISEFAYGGFAALQLIAANAVSPFSKDRDGMKIGEGVGLLLLRRMEDAILTHPKKIIASIMATAQTSDSHHLTQPHPQGTGVALALSQVVDVLRPPDLLIAHATGTLANDAAEYEAFRSVFGRRLPNIPVIALKGRFGHPLGAAGVLELIATLACAQNGCTPTSADTIWDDDAFGDLQLLQGECRKEVPQEIVAISAGFGGVNAAIRVQCAMIPQQHDRQILSQEQNVQPQRACITAVGAISSAGRGIKQLVKQAQEPGTCGELTEAILAPMLDRIQTRRLAILPQIMIAAIRDLVETAGLTPDELRDTPLIAANWTGTPQFTIEYYRDLLRSGIDLANPMLFAQSVPNVGSAHCSIAFGIRAASLSVIGRRTAALEAISLAAAKITTNSWPRAIIVAAEEAHPVSERILSHCAEESMQFRSSGIAVLLEKRSNEVLPCGRSAIEIQQCIGATGKSATLEAEVALFKALKLGRACVGAHITSQSPLDRNISILDPSVMRVGSTELGCVSALTSLFVSDTLRANPQDSVVVLASDPHGACWSLSTAQHKQLLK